eukprot:646992-Prymnesium_polylepis.1
MQCHSACARVDVASWFRYASRVLDRLRNECVLTSSAHTGLDPHSCVPRKFCFFGRSRPSRCVSLLQ